MPESVSGYNKVRSDNEGFLHPFRYRQETLGEISDVDIKNECNNCLAIGNLGITWQIIE